MVDPNPLALPPCYFISRRSATPVYPFHFSALLALSLIFSYYRFHLFQVDFLDLVETLESKFDGSLACELRFAFEVVFILELFFFFSSFEKRKEL